MRGLQRALSMAGLLMFSKLALGAVPPLPGKIGKLLQESFAILEQLNKEFSISGSIDPQTKEKKKFLKPKLLLIKIDRTLCKISGY